MRRGGEITITLIGVTIGKGAVYIGIDLLVIIYRPRIGSRSRTMISGRRQGEVLQETGKVFALAPFFAKDEFVIGIVHLGHFWFLLTHREAVDPPDMGVK